MTLTSKLVDDLTAGFDDALEPLDDKEIDAEDTEELEDEITDTDDSKTDEDEDEEDTGDDDEGYTIDDADVDKSIDEEVKPETKAEKDANQAYADLNPEQRYILENIQPLTIRGTVGDSDEVKEFKAFDPAQLPAGFKFVDDRDREVAAKAFNQLEAKALSLQNEFRTKAQEDNNKKFKEANDKADWEDIAFLQKNGDLPKFKLKPTDEGFEDDPTAKLIQDVLDFKDKRNAKYLEDHQQKGRPFRMIGFEEAFQMYKPAAADKSAASAQSKEDKERKGIAKRTTKTNGTKGNDGIATRVTLRNSRDMQNYIDSLDI